MKKFWVVLFTISFVSCSPAMPADSTVTIPAAPAPTGTETPQPSLEPEAEAPTETTVFKPTNTIDLETETPLPTLSPAEAQERVMQLFETNGGCELPCWWGITPGQTRSIQALEFINSFAREVVISANSEDQVEYYATFDVPNSINPNEEFSFTLYIHNGIVQSFFSEGSWKSGMDYSLSGILTTFGPPSEVWVNAVPVTMNDRPRYTYVLFYPEIGFMTAKIGTGIVKNDTLEVCPQDSNSPPPFLWLWSPEVQKTFDDVANDVLINVSPQIGIKYYLLEKVTNLDTETFFEIFSDPNAEDCIYTPIDIWP